MESSRINTIMGMAAYTARTGKWYPRSDFKNDEEWDMYQGDVKEMVAMKKSGKKVVWMTE